MRRFWLAAACALGLMGGCVAPRQGPLTVWVVPDTRAIAPDDPPLLENEVYSRARQRVTLQAARNETVALQVALQTTQPPDGPFDVLISDLSGPGGTLAAEALATRYRAARVPVAEFRSWYPARSGRAATPTTVLDPLVPWNAPRGGGPLNLNDARAEVVWLDLAVPRDVAPGEYVGRLAIVRKTPGSIWGARPSTVFECELRLRVLPLTLPGTRGLPIVARVDPRDLLEEYLRWPRVSAEETRLIPSSPSHLAAVRLVRQTMATLAAHRLTPVLWASFPKFVPDDRGGVALEWSEYDALVSTWLDGSAFNDGIGLTHWPLPVSLDYPDASTNGGVDSPAYARILGAYVRACERHFAERGWGTRGLVRLFPTAPLTDREITRVHHARRTLKQAGVAAPFMAHLPPASMRPLGWLTAPRIDPLEVDIWAPPADWFQPEDMQQQRGLGRLTWFVPAGPPAGGSLRPEAPPADAILLAWQAFRYECQGIWIDDAARLGPPTTGTGGLDRVGLLYSGVPYGVLDAPLGSIRLKRLRRGELDYELLRLLESSGQALLARRTAQQLVPRAFTDAFADNLITPARRRELADPLSIWLAAAVLRQELCGGATGSAADVLTDWQRLFLGERRVESRVNGARLVLDNARLKGLVSVTLCNDSTRALSGRWSIADAADGWVPEPAPDISVEPGAVRSQVLSIAMNTLNYSEDGLVALEARFTTPDSTTFRAPGRLAVTACPVVTSAPIVDGRIEDWPRDASNSAGRFLLVRGRRPAENFGAGAPPPGDYGATAPTLPTRAFFCMDDHSLYVAVICALRPDEPPLYTTDNQVPYDGAIPWGQDVVEIVLNPGNLTQGTPGDLYLLQVKPSGLVLSHHGCPTQPPMAEVAPWASGARAASRVADGQWIVELSLPLKSLGPSAAQNRIWGVDVTRLDSRRGEYSAWSGAEGHCYSPGSNGNLLLVRP